MSENTLPELPIGLMYESKIDVEGAYCPKCRGVIKTPTFFVLTTRRRTELGLDKFFGANQPVCLNCTGEMLAAFSLELYKRANTDREALSLLSEVITNTSPNTTGSEREKLVENKSDLEQIIGIQQEIIHEISEFLSIIMELENYMEYTIKPPNDNESNENDEETSQE